MSKQWNSLPQGLALACLLLISGGALAKEKLVFLTWSEYLDPELVEAFQQQFDAEIDFVYFETDDHRTEIMLETDGQGYDLILTSGHDLRSYLKRGWIAPVDQAAVPNLKHVEMPFEDQFPHAAGSGVPYTWGTIGIAYRTDLVNEPVKRWIQFYRPEPALKGKVVAVDTMVDMVGMGLKALGYSANETDPKALKEVEDLLLAQKPFIKDYSYIALSEESTLVTGEAAMAMVYSGDALMIQEYSDDIAYVIPEEGTNLWVDYLVVSRGARNPKLAWAFINFLNEPENAAQHAEYLYAPTCNKAAEKLLSAELLEDPQIYPDAATLARSEAYRQLPGRAVKRRNEIFSRVVE